MAQQDVGTTVVELTLHGAFAVQNLGTGDVYWTRDPDGDPTTVGVKMAAGTGYEFPSIGEKVPLRLKASSGTQDVRYERIS